jgi:hypothetical protein
MSNNILTRDQKKSLAQELFQQGKSKTEISNLLGVPRSTIFDWVTGRKHHTVTTIVDEYYTEEGELDGEDVYVPIDPVAAALSHSAKETDVKQFIQELAPIVYPAPERTKVRQEPNKIACVIGDCHFGCEDWNTLDLFLQTVAETKPEKVILNGDTLDMFAISRYPKDARYRQSLIGEREAYHKFLKLLHDITEPFGSEIYETNANHSGNSVEGRLWRYLSSQLGELADIAKDELSYENLFFPKESWSRIKLVDEVILPTNFLVYHGTVVRKIGAMSARGEWEKKMTSTMTNHTHRMGMTAQRIPAAGLREDIFNTNYENACACKMDPDYAPCCNWQNGFSIINYTDDVIGVEPVVVHGSKATVNSIGKTLRV